MTTYNYHMPADLNITQGGGDTPNSRVSTNLTTPIEGRTGVPTLYKALTEKTGFKLGADNQCTTCTTLSDSETGTSFGLFEKVRDADGIRIQYKYGISHGAAYASSTFDLSNSTTHLGTVAGAPVFTTTATFDSINVSNINVNWKGGVGCAAGGWWNLIGEPVIAKTDQGQHGGSLAFNTPNMSLVAPEGDLFVTLSTKTNAVQIGPTEFEPPTRLQFVFCGNGGPPTRLERNGVSVVVINPANISQAVPLLISPEICKTEARLKALSLADHLKVGQHVLLLPDPPTTAGVHYTQEVYIVPWDDATYDDLIKIAFKTITV